MKETARFASLAFCCWLLIVTGTFLGCSSVSPNSPTGAAEEPSFPVKSIAVNKFNFDSIDKQRALAAFRKVRANALFELVIDREGNVVNIRTVRSKLDYDETAAYKTYITKGMKFSLAPANDPQPYRTLYYPLSTRTTLEIK